MDALIVIFLTGLIGLFVGMLKKPMLNLLVTMIGLVLAFFLQLNNGLYTSPLAKYQVLEFNISQLYFSLLAIAFCMLIVLAGYQYFKRDAIHTGDYYGLLLFSLCGAICLIGFTDLFMFFLGLEILSIPIYVMVGIKKQDVLSAEASIKYFFTGAFATAILLFGIALLYGATGSFNLVEIRGIIQSGEYQPTFLFIGILFILGAFLFKVGAVPFHFWGPDVYQGAPEIVTAFMATVVKLAALLAFFKLFNGTFQDLAYFWIGALYFAIILSLFVGYLGALKQTKFKRLLAYSSISNTGYALFALLSMSNSSIGSLWIFLVGYGCATIALLTISIAIHNEDDEISSFKGIGYKNPFIGFIMIISLLSLAGIPPLTGFFGKFALLMNAYPQHLYLVILALISSAIGAFLYLRLIVLSLSKDTDTESVAMSSWHYIVLGICAVGILGAWLVVAI
jgi:NADH-quinone oxidoreductase subunit N